MQTKYTIHIGGHTYKERTLSEIANIAIDYWAHHGDYSETIIREDTGEVVETFRLKDTKLDYIFDTVCELLYYGKHEARDFEPTVLRHSD